jgi:hypothetical protein
MFVTLLVGAVLVVITAHQTTPPPQATLVSSADLVRALTRGGATAAEHGRAPRDAFPFFSPRATRLSVGGDDVHVFQYPTADEAIREAAHISPAGSPIATTQVTWMSPPRFYRKDRLIVLYVGTDPAVARALEGLLGRPFAGLR